MRTPRDRDGSFEPQLVRKRQTRLAGLDDRVLDLYAGGMSVRDIAAHLSGLYGVEVGCDTISRATGAVLENLARGAPGRLRRSTREPGIAALRQLQARPATRQGPAIPNADAALVELERFDERWGARYPMIAEAWRRDWERITPFLALPEPLRRVVYTTNTIEAMHRQIRKASTSRSNEPRRSGWSARNWTAALAALKIHFGDRLPRLTNEPSHLGPTPRRTDSLLTDVLVLVPASPRTSEASADKASTESAYAPP